MALSEREQKMLEEMERELMAGDSQFDRKLNGSGQESKSAKKLVLGVIVMLAGIALLVFAAALQVAFFGVAAFAVMFIGLVLSTSNFRLPGLPNMKPESAKNPNYFEDRWNRRFGE